MGTYITRLVDSYRIVDKRWPVFSDSKSRNARAHDNVSLAKFEAHIQAFLASKEGKKLEGWTTEKVLFSPVFLSHEQKMLSERGYASLDLPAYASLF